MNTATYVRKTFHVNAVQVTEDNIEEVAKWCGGEVLTKQTPIKNAIKVETFVKVPVLRPLNDKQSSAFISDWVLEHEGGYKVYTDRAFVKSFEQVTVYTEEQSKAHLGDYELPTTTPEQRAHLEANGLSIPTYPNSGTVYTEKDAKDQTIDYHFPEVLL